MCNELSSSVELTIIYPTELVDTDIPCNISPMFYQITHYDTFSYWREILMVFVYKGRNDEFVWCDASVLHPVNTKAPSLQVSNALINVRPIAFPVILMISCKRYLSSKCSSVVLVHFENNALLYIWVLLLFFLKWFFLQLVSHFVSTNLNNIFIWSIIYLVNTKLRSLFEFAGSEISFVRMCSNLLPLTCITFTKKLTEKPCTNLLTSGM